jgi:hypothetical protein
MLDPILLAVLGILVLIGSVIGFIASSPSAGCRRCRVAVDVALGALAALAIGFPAVSHLSAESIEIVGKLALIGSPEPWLLPLGAYLSGALAAIGLGRFVSI